MKLIYKIGCLLAVLLLVGCSKAPRPIYYWNDYQATIYQYYQSDSTSPEQQIEKLKEIIQKAQAKNLPVPPGLHAHLGMLYSNTGHPELAIPEFEAEKAQFPESTTFMNFLINKSKGGKK
ncbi:DUF4810 domain-containing protein [Budvicia diplopodorum]|uniref:DUF4810 domain-containing protein n=1 Tax=Budvicia diplopodorum TaxID=1119056 RepID=UPI00135CE057|nr:DUF4810 domain-containing protein [Budvicia diplopodorum]